MKILIILTILLLLLLALLLLVILVISLYSKYTESYIPHKDIKILNLVLYSKDNSYDKMYDITRRYYAKFYPQVKTIYYLFDDSISNPTFKDDILLIPGKESYLPGILDKTIKAIDITKNMDYDYLLRSNISTVVNIKMLLNYLTRNPDVDYGGSWALTHIRKGFRDPLNGINDDRYDGLDFISGTGIILSRNAVRNILENKNKIYYTVVDDVSIGFFFQRNTNIKPITFNSSQSYDEKDLSKEYNTDIEQREHILPYKGSINLDIIFHRNRSSNRENDVKNMKVICNIL